MSTKKTKSKVKLEFKTVKEIDKELEKLDQQRMAAKERGRELNEQKRHLLMREQVTSRILTGSPFSSAEVQWMDDNPEEWKEIKEANKDKKGSRKAQVAKATR